VKGGGLERNLCGALSRRRRYRERDIRCLVRLVLIPLLYWRELAVRSHDELNAFSFRRSRSLRREVYLVSHSHGT